MTPRERVLASINHTEPDRVPLGFAGINLSIDKKLKRYLGLDSRDDDGLLEALGIDLRVVNLPYIGTKLHKDIAGRMVDPLWGWRRKSVKNDYGYYLEYCDFPLKNATIDEVEAWPLPDPDDFDYESLIEQCERYKNYCVVYGNPGLVDIINSAGFLRTMEQILVDLAMGDEVGLKLIDRRNEINLQILEKVLDTVGSKIDMIWMGEDLGTQNSPLISESMFGEYIKPRHQKFIDLAKQYNKKTMLHSCGSSSWAFDDLIKMGIDVIDTLQPQAQYMSPAYLKRKFGDKLSFHGCISTAGPLSYGTIDDVVENIRQTLNIMMPGGGYVMAPTHMIQDNTLPENIVAMYETAKKLGVYESYTLKGKKFPPRKM